MRWAALALCATLGGCTVATPGASSQAIIGGADDPGDPAVVMWIAQVPGSMVATICTASLISPHVLLTAAHCASPDLVGAGAMYTFYQGPNVDHASSRDFSPIKETHFDPDFSINDVTKGHDIAVGILASPLALTPLTMNYKGLDKSMVGQPARLVGYGKSDGADTAGATAGTKRQVTTQMISYDDKLVRFGMAGQTTCEGDSGGPAFMTIGGVESIVGVVSFGDVNCGSLGVDTRVDQYVDSFVAQYVDAVDPGVLPPASHGCAVASRAPASTSGLLALGLVLLVARLARRRA